VSDQHAASPTAAIPVSRFNRFNKAQRIWKATPEYFNDPWQYFVDFIDLLKSRGARFVTMSEALDGKYDRDQVNILLDHHIDSYPIETEVMCRWELAHGVVANVYLFNEFDYDDTIQRRIWRVEDLNVGFYQELERRGFEIGYHQNAVGLVRTRKVGRRYDKVIPEEDAEAARRIFARDVDNLRRYFDIRTFIPHGAGEGNAALVRLPDGYEWLEWVYNNRSRNGTVKPKLRWQNWSDSCAQRPQRIHGYQSDYVVRLDNLHVKGFLAEPGLNHVLIHPGRFGTGMPYELYEGLPPLEEHTQSALEFCLDGFDDGEPPLSVSRLIADWETAAGVRQRRRAWADRADTYEIMTHAEKYYLLSDDLEVIRNHLAVNDPCIAFLLHDHKLAPQDRKMPRRRSAANSQLMGAAIAWPAGAPQEIDRAFAQRFEPFFNQVYTAAILKHLSQVGIRYDVLHLTRLKIERRRELRWLVELLGRYRDAAGVILDAEVAFGGPRHWDRAVERYGRADSVRDHFIFETTRGDGFGARGFALSVRKRPWPGLDWSSAGALRRRSSMGRGRS